jgi:hypothetical protein
LLAGIQESAAEAVDASGAAAARLIAGVAADGLGGFGRLPVAQRRQAVRHLQPAVGNAAVGRVLAGDPLRSAVLLKPEFKADQERIVAFIESQLSRVPGSPGHRLNQEALARFVEMRDAAAREGVELAIVGPKSAHRSAEVAARRAKAAGNPKAVAEFSAHALGLAVDLKMSHGAGRSRRAFKEATTKPMQNVVDMRQSPVHKWLFLHAAEFGWFPWHNEPWHWEYNPPGFKEQFRAALAAFAADSAATPASRRAGTSGSE